MLPTTRFGGHIVSGHVDGVGEIVERIPVGRAVDLWVNMPKKSANTWLKKARLPLMASV